MGEGLWGLRHAEEGRKALVPLTRGDVEYQQVARSAREVTGHALEMAPVHPAEALLVELFARVYRSAEEPFYLHVDARLLVLAFAVPIGRCPLPVVAARA